MEIDTRGMVSEIFELYMNNLWKIIGGALIALSGFILIITLPPAFVSYYNYIMRLIERRDVKPSDMFYMIKKNFISGWKFFLIYTPIIVVLLLLLFVPGLLFAIFTVYSIPLYLTGFSVLGSLKLSFKVFKDYYEASVIAGMIVIAANILGRFFSYMFDVVFEGLGIIVTPFIIPVPILFSSYIVLKVKDRYSV